MKRLAFYFVLQLLTNMGQCHGKKSEQRQFIKFGGSIFDRRRIIWCGLTPDSTGRYSFAIYMSCDGLEVLRKTYVIGQHPDAYSRDSALKFMYELEKTQLK